MSDDHIHDTAHAHTGHEHVEHVYDSDRASREHSHARGLRLKKCIALAVATGGGLVAAGHVGLVIAHVVLPILVGVAIWQWAGGLVVGLLVVGVVLYLGVRGRLTKSDKEGTT